MKKPLNLNAFSKNPQLAILDELHSLNAVLDDIKVVLETTAKMEMEHHKETSVKLNAILNKEVPLPEIPEPKEVDLSRVEALLEKLLEKEDVTEDVFVKLEIQ